MKAKTKAKSVSQALLWGIISAVLYLLVFMNAQTVMEYLSRGGIFATVLLVIALLFSVVHGTFANYLIEVIGFKPSGKGGH